MTVLLAAYTVSPIVNASDRSASNALLLEKVSVTSDAQWLNQLPINVHPTANLQLLSHAQLPSRIEIAEGDIFRRTSNGLRSIALPDSGQLWIDGIVPYQLDPQLSQYVVDSILEAISYWNEVSGITFMPIEEVAKAEGVSTDSVYFRKNTGCASWVGRQGGQQEVWVGPFCATGSIMHEIGHVLGLEHEHTRPDRDQYIQIHWNNISADKAHNFDVARTDAMLLGEYDYDSIMHYGEYNFTDTGAPTITPLDGSRDRIGQRIAPSQGDLNAVAQLYAADVSVVSHLDKIETGYEATIHVDNNREQGAHDIQLQVSIEAPMVEHQSDTDWNCKTDEQLEVLCTLDRLPGGGESTLQLTLDSMEDIDAYNAVVSSKTPDIDLQNNSNWSDAPIVEIAVEPAIASAQLQDDDAGILVGGALSISWMLLALLGISRKRSIGRFD